MVELIKIDLELYLERGQEASSIFNELRHFLCIHILIKIDILSAPQATEALFLDPNDVRNVIGLLLFLSCFLYSFDRIFALTISSSYFHCPYLSLLMC